MKLKYVKIKSNNNCSYIEYGIFNNELIVMIRHDSNGNRKINLDDIVKKVDVFGEDNKINMSHGSSEDITLILFEKSGFNNVLSCEDMISDYNKNNS